MSSFVGFANFNKDISKELHTIKDMNEKMKKSIAVEEDYYLDKNIVLGYRNDKIQRKIMTIKYNGVAYTVVFNGQIYNKQEIKKELQEIGYEFERRF